MSEATAIEIQEALAAITQQAKAMQRDDKLRAIGAWMVNKVQAQVAERGVQAAARNLRKQGVPVELALGAILGQPTRCAGWLNVYEAGHWHTAGKPCAFDRHAGDFYPTREAALADIDPPSHYVDTVPVWWTEREAPVANKPLFTEPFFKDGRAAFAAAVAAGLPL